MAIVVMGTDPGPKSREVYDLSMKAFDGIRVMPPGSLAHIAVETDEGLFIIGVWESIEAERAAHTGEGARAMRDSLGAPRIEDLLGPPLPAYNVRTVEFNQWTGNAPPPETWAVPRLQPKLHHVHLSVTDLDASVGWYADKLACLGFKELFRVDPMPGVENTRMAMVKAGNLILELVQQPHTGPNPKAFKQFYEVGTVPGYGHLNIAVDDAAEVIEVLREKGVRIADNYQDLPPPFLHRCFWDLEGNLIAISSGWDAVGDQVAKGSP